MCVCVCARVCVYVGAHPRVCVSVDSDPIKVLSIQVDDIFQREMRYPIKEAFYKTA